jgi:uncharacterized protein YkwD
VSDVIDDGFPRRRRRRRGRRGCLGCVGCLSPFLLLGVGASLALYLAPRPDSADGLDLAGLSRLIGDGLTNTDGEVQAPDGKGPQVNQLLEQLGEVTQQLPSGGEAAARLKDALPGSGATTRPKPIEAGARIFAPVDRPGEQVGEAATDASTADAPAGRVWMWEDAEGATHITKEPPPAGAKVTSVSDPGSHMRVQVHDDTGNVPVDVASTPALKAGRPVQPPPLAKLGPAVLDEINKLRADPTAYAKRLVAVRKTFQGTVYRSVSQRLIASQEGFTAFDDAIAELVATDSLPPLRPLKACQRSAKAHATHLGRTGGRGHAGKGGSRPLDRVMKGAKPGQVEAVGEVISYGAVLPEEIVMSWLVDDGVPERGHREALLDPRYTRAGASCRPHLLNPVCVVDLVEPPETE